MVFSRSFVYAVIGLSALLCIARPVTVHADAGASLGSAPDPALDALRAAVDRNPGDAAAHNNLGVCLAGKGDWTEALSQMNTAVTLAPESVEMRLSLANAFYNAGRRDEAQKAYQDILARSAGCGGAHYGLGNTLSDAGQTKLALAEYAQAVQLMPDDFAAHREYGQALLADDQEDASLAQFQECVRLQPSDPQAHQWLACALVVKQRLDEAAGEFRVEIGLITAPAAAEQTSAEQTSAEQTSLLAHAHDSLGTTLMAQNKLTDAAAELKQAVTLAPDDPAVHNDFGLALYSLDKRAEARAQWRLVAKMNDPVTAAAARSMLKLP